MYLESMTQVGKVTHYYNKKGVAIIELSDKLAVGDKVKFEKNGKEFEQTVDSIQIERENISEAKSGDVIGMKVIQEPDIGATVSKE